MSPACGISDVTRFPPVRESLTPDYRSVGHLRFSLRGILSLDRDCRNGFGWDCSLARCLLLLLWMASWTVDWRNKVLYCGKNRPVFEKINPLNPELNPICYLLTLLGAHHFFHVSRIRVKLLTFRRLMSYIYGAPILDVSRSHTTTQHSR
jgi:hypothetical protein